MRRRIGRAGLIQRRNQDSQFKARGTAMRKELMTHAANTLTEFKSNLEKFALKHKKSINQDPEFRMQFQKMCSSIGVDPLASNKGFWAELLGSNDFYYELGVQILDVCLLLKMRGSKAAAVSVDDIKTAVSKMKILGAGFSLLSAGSSTMICSVPVELNVDHTALISLAHERGYIDTLMIKKNLNWSKSRAEQALMMLTREGMVWIDDGGAGDNRQYWFLNRQ
eukprot:GSMAST32.ASY1.ANO1.881.1 assembled CDS